MKSEITKEELDNINCYKNEKYLLINQLFSYNIDTDILLVDEQNVKFSNEMLEQNIILIKKIFEIIIKNFKKNKSYSDTIFYISSSISEIDNLKHNQDINNFFFATKMKEINKNFVRPVIIKIHLDNNVPFIELDDNNVLISPFTSVTEIKQIQLDDEKENIDYYEIYLKQQELAVLSDKEIDNIYKNFFDNAEIINEKINTCIELDNDSIIHYENIRKLEQLLEKHTLSMEQLDYEQDTTPEEKQSNLDDMVRINSELKSIKNKISEIYTKRQEISDYILNWKHDIISFLKNEFKKLLDNIVVEEIKDEQSDIKKDIPEIDIVKKETAENIAVINTLLKNIKDLIVSQQNHARIADLLDSNYKALNNAFEMKNYAEELDNLYKAIENKVDLLCIKDKDELDKISKTNLQVSILLNYLNNSKSAVGKKIKRFDEIKIIEENELKKEIAETIKNIRCEAELKKLRDDAEIIEDKSTFKKFIGKITGRNKLDIAMLNQIQIRQNAVRKTFKTKMPLAHNYSIHNIIAEIEMFIKENEDDELVLEDVSQLRKMKDILKRNFVISDSKVEAIIAQKSGKNLPLRL